MNQIAGAIDLLVTLEYRQSHPLSAVVGRDMDDLLDGSVAACLIPLETIRMLTGLPMADLVADAIDHVFPARE